MNAYCLTHQCGNVFYQGNLEFGHHGNALFTIVGSRVNVYDLVNQTCRTVSVQGRSDLEVIAVSPDQKVLIQVDFEGYAQVISLRKDVLLAQINFHSPVSKLSFSPDGRFLAVGLQNKLRVFECCFQNKQGSLLPFLSFSAWHSQPITHFNFFKDYLVTSSEDQTVRFCHLGKQQGYIPITLTGHRKPVLGTFFNQDQIYTVSSDARVFVWEWGEASEEFLNKQVYDYKRRAGRAPKSQSNTHQINLVQKHQLQHEGVFTLNCADMISSLLVVGFKTGNFALYSVNSKEVLVLHTLNMTEYEISCLRINPFGEWIAFGSKTLGQLVVWEWKSETYVLRQMGHSSELVTAEFSPEGHILATGGIDGKVKLWERGINFATFSEHLNSVAGLAFTPSNALVSASQDGTVRAYDINKYKQFRVLTTANPVEFTCVACDRSGEVVCAGSKDYQIYVWALPTGALCEILSGHTGPVSCLSFTSENMLVSGSWDTTARIWDVFERRGGSEPLVHSSEVLSLSVRPDSRQIAVACSNGEISLWSLPNCEEQGSIEGRRDVAGGRGYTDRFTAKNNPQNKKFNSICYSPDGWMVLGGGESKFACIYDLRHKVLLHRFSFTENRSLSGVLEKLNSSNITEAGPISELELDEYNLHSDFNQAGISEPHRPADILRKPYKEVRVTKVCFSNKEMALVTTEGVLIYSRKPEERFTPLQLSLEASHGNVIKSLVQEEFATAMLLALKLGESPQDVLYRVPPSEVSNVASQISGQELLRLLTLLYEETPKTKDLGLLLVWVRNILKYHSSAIKGLTQVKTLYRTLNKRFAEVISTCRENNYTLQFLNKSS